MPVASRGYPGSYAELLSWFPDESVCLDYLEWLRWPEGCAVLAARRVRGGGWVAAGAAWQTTSHKHGVAALGVQRSLGLGSYQTAWAMLHRYRAAMVCPGRERLTDHVEVDEGYVGVERRSRS